jgi:hypothetical protein
MCTHHWIIEPPNGPTSKGYCKLCPEVREFRNYPEEQEYSAWGFNNSNSIAVPIGNDSMDLIAKLIKGDMEAISGCKC